MPASTDVVRHAKRMADSLKAPWTAVHVETGRNLNLSEAERDRIAEAMRLAERLGAETVTLPGQDVADTIADYARANNFTHIIIVQPPRSWWRELFYGSLAQQLIRKAAAPACMCSDATREASKPRAFAAARTGEARAYLGSLAFVAVSLGVALLLHQMLGVASVAMAFLTAVLVSAVVYGLWPALFASFVSVLAYNFFFLPPLYTFTIADPENVAALFFFGVTAVIASNLTARVRAQAIVRATACAHHRGAVPVQPQAGGRGEPRRSVVGDRASDRADAEGACRHPAAGGRRRSRCAPAFRRRTCWTTLTSPPRSGAGRGTTSPGRGSDTLPGAKRLFMPMNTGRGAVGVVGIDSDEPGPILTPDQHRLLDALADQAALAIERVNLVEDVDRARLVAETDRLRAALLTSISHDLRTPLASILGSATSLSEGERWMRRHGST